ncbi:hypothetical protein IQ277_27490 [Nostocales cyanobacterium LEGE 12452]|nr:hypothetical protein [Nostocales cyanobacterium LEGE 12452]
MSTEDNANQTEFSIRDRNTQIKRNKAIEMNCFTHLGKLNLQPKYLPLLLHAYPV